MSGVLEGISGRLRGVPALKWLVLGARGWRTRVIDQWLNIDTVNPRGQRLGLHNAFADPVAYEPVDYLLLRKYMRQVRLQPNDVIFDVGCGMGRALALFARRHVKMVVGIEYDQALAEMARRNSEKLRGRRAPIEVRQGDAIEADYDQATVLWMFNPFGPRTMTAVLDRVEDSLRRIPRGLQLAYINPRHEDLFAARSWLRHEGVSSSKAFSTYHASYWTADTGRFADSAPA